VIDPVEAGASSLAAVSRKVEAIAHNLANASTAGYKRLTCDLVSGTASAGTGGKSITDRTTVDFTQGHLVQTGRPLDLALFGKGFFVLETPQGELFTRHGVFQANAQGQLVEASGRTVAGEGGPIVLPPDAGEASIRVAADGRVFASGREVGRLRIVEFADPSVLTPAGLNAFRAPRTAPQEAAAATTVQQGFQEASNVQIVDELVGLITATRAYEANVRVTTLRGERGKSLLQVAAG